MQIGVFRSLTMKAIMQQWLSLAKLPRSSELKPGSQPAPLTHTRCNTIPHGSFGDVVNTLSRTWMRRRSSEVLDDARNK